MSTPEQVIMDGLQVLLKSIQLDVSSEVGEAQLEGDMVTFGSTWYRGPPKIASQVEIWMVVAEWILWLIR